MLACTISSLDQQQRTMLREWKRIIGTAFVIDRIDFQIGDNLWGGSDFMGRLGAGTLGFFTEEHIPVGFTSEWHDQWRQEDRTKRLEMETAFVNGPANTGCGWNSTRRGLIDTFVKHLH